VLKKPRDPPLLVVAGPIRGRYEKPDEAELVMIFDKGRVCGCRRSRGGAGGAEQRADLSDRQAAGAGLWGSCCKAGSALPPRALDERRCTGHSRTGCMFELQPPPRRDGQPLVRNSLYRTRPLSSWPYANGIFRWSRRMTSYFPKAPDMYEGCP